MTTITKYVCDLCGKTFDDEDECEKHEIWEKISKYSNSVIFFDRDKKIIPLKEVASTSHEVCGIYVTVKSAIPSIEEFCEFYDIITPWSCEGGHNRKTAGLYLCDEDGYCWYLPADRIEELKKKMKEYGVDA